MIDVQTRIQIECFLNELGEVPHLAHGDYSPLYAKYPKVRICIRRAFMIIQKRLHPAWSAADTGVLL